MSDESGRFASFAPAAPADEAALLRVTLSEALCQAAESEARLFRRELGRVVAQAARHGTPAALLEIRVEGLSDAVAADGRSSLDEAARKVGEVLAALIRATDFLARTGEHRFSLILDHLDQDSAIDAADRLGRCIAAAVPGLTPVVAVTGILAGDALDDVLARAARNFAAAEAQR